MKALRISKPFAAEITDIPAPPPPGEGEVLLRIKTVGLCGSDLTTFRGLNPMVTYPRIPGHEIAAVIEQTGPGVPAQWMPGLPVLVSPYTSCGKCAACRRNRHNTCRNNQTLGVQRDGAITELLVVPYTKLFTSPKLSFAEMALVEPLTVGFHAADRGDITASDTVVVIGCGAIGLGAIAGASTRGAHVIAVDLDDQKLALAKRCGAADTIHSTKQNLHDALQNLTNGEGPDVMIEAVGLPATFRACVEEVCFSGRVIYIGYAKAPVEYETKYFVMKELDIRGSRNATQKDFANVIAYLESGAFPTSAAITRTVSLQQSPQALTEWEKNPASINKIHIAIS